MIGTVERDIRLTRDFSMNIEVEPADYFKRVTSDFHRRTRRPRGQILKHACKD